MPRMRLLKQAHAEIVAADPDTALTKTALRRLVLSGVIPTVYSGRKRFINMDALLDYLDSSGGTVKPPTPDNVGAIRPVQL